MADFLTDSDDEKKVDELLSQAMDLTVLEQVAAINCSGFNDSDLPSHLETRFQKLKSFPVEKSKSDLLSTKSFNSSKTPEFKNRDLINEAKKVNPSEEIKGYFSDERSKEKMGSKSTENGLKKNPVGKNCVSPTESFENESFPSLKKNAQGKMGKKQPKSPSSASWDDFSGESLSPPAKTGCFWCSPKKASRKNSKENRSLDRDLDWGKNDEFLSDMSNFSSKSQKKKMMKAMKEEEEICREAEKIIKWAKQASARMDVSGIEDELSDNENFK
ncbi:uncharacterized protein LOC111391024 [Olea europaea var. sylvestris]|uniref:uncharacterized protein LOC111391024 n=1 Tax=Olea europaea var. sylvestris TaxID=158386 RepID=UPI000C1D7870|nr:uncharacterized protein LOC111391024 [Olea europaea var. sylvestris]